MLKAERETMAAFARRMGVARSTITRAAQAGRVAVDREGPVLVQASLQLWADTRGNRDDVAERHAAARGQALPSPAPGQAQPSPATGPAAALAALVHAQALPRPLAAPGGPATAPATASADAAADDDADTSGGARAQAKAAALWWRNASLQLEIDLATAARLDRAAAISEAQGLGGTLRAAVERLIDQTAPRLAAAATDADRRRLLLTQLAIVRRELRREFPRALRRLQPQRQRAAQPAEGSA
jgi:hypothetical protein